MTRLALVEDNDDNRMLICALLEDDYEIDEYPDGPSALDGMAVRRPALALLDISLPGIDGVEVLARMRSSGLEDVPCIALTAHAMQGDRERFLAAGFDAYVAKPIVDETLLYDAIDACLERT